MKLQGLHIAKPGENVFNPASGEYAFDTDHSTLKLYKTGFAVVTTNSGGLGSTIVPHGFGFAPAFYGFRKHTARWDFMDGGNEYANAWFPIGNPNRWTKGDSIHHGIAMSSDRDNLYIDITNGLASTSYLFKYYLLADLAQNFQGTPSLALRSHYGIKVAKPGIDVRYAKPHELGFCSDFKALQFPESHVKTATIGLGGYFTSYHDQSREQGSWVNFEHNLGFAPFYLAFGHLSTWSDNFWMEIPFYGTTGYDAFNKLICSFCDATRVRVSFWRGAFYSFGAESLPDETLTLKVFIFNEDLEATYG